MRMQTEHGAADKVLRTRLNHSHTGIAVLDGRRKVSDLERRPHGLVLKVRHLALEYEALRSAADATETGPDNDIVGPAGWRRLAAQGPMPRPLNPEGSGNRLSH